MDETQVAQGLVDALASGELGTIIKSLIGLMLIREITHWGTKVHARLKGSHEADPLEKLVQMQKEVLMYVREQTQEQIDYARSNLTTKEQASRHQDRNEAMMQEHEAADKERFRVLNGGLDAIRSKL